jgi:hypothetical protein
MPALEQPSAQLNSIALQQTDLHRAVAAGELWMDADVAENAAKCCEQTVRDIDRLVSDAQPLIRRRRFGGNADGNRAAKRYANAAQDYINTMRNAQRVFTNMAATFRAAARTVTEADESGRQAFRGQPQ